jgi:hypothetical protein
MSKPQVSYSETPESETVHIERDGKLFEVKVTHEGIIVDVYTDGGNTHLDSPFAATWDEMLPEDDND